MSLENEMSKLTKAIELLCQKLDAQQVSQVIETTTEKTKTDPVKEEPAKTEPEEEPAKLTTKNITEAARKAVERDTSNRDKAKEIIGKYGATKAAELKDEDLEAVLKEIENL